MKKTLFITMLTAALLGGKVYANTGFEGGIIRNLLGDHDLAGDNGADGEKLRIFEDPESNYEALDNVFGYFGVGAEVWESSGNVVTMEGGIVQTVYGAYTVGTVKEQTIWMKGGTVRGTICGGVSTTDDHNYSMDNTVIVTGGKVGAIIGGQAEAQDDAYAYGNKVYITGLSADCAPYVCGGRVEGETRKDAISNEVHLVGDGAAIFIKGERLEGHSMRLGDVQGAYCPRGERDNSVHIYGSGIHARSVNHTQILNFHLVDGLATTEAPMLALSGTDQYWHKFNMAEFSLGIIADDVTDWGVLAGHTVTLVESQLAIQGFGDAHYKVVDVSKAGQKATRAILSLGSEDKALYLKVLTTASELLEPGTTKTAGSATIGVISQIRPGVLDNITLGTDVIRGKGQASSLLFGLDINSTADLTLESLTLDSYNKISVGDHTLTLKDVAISGDWTVEENKRLTLRGNTTVTGSITLEEDAALDLGGNSFHMGGEDGNRVILNGSTTIANGTLTLCDNLSGSNSITLADNATLNLGEHTISNSVSLAGNTVSIGNGAVNGNLNVAGGNTLKLCGNLGGTDDIILGGNAKLDLGGYTVTKGLQFGSGSAVSNGRIVLGNDMSATGPFTLTDVAVELGSHTLDLGDNEIQMQGSCAIGNGSLKGSLSVAGGNTLTLLNHLGGEGSIALYEGAALNLGGYTLSNKVLVDGNATAGNGVINASVLVGKGYALTLSGNLAGEKSITLGPDATLDLAGKALSKQVAVNANAYINTGTLNSDVYVKDGVRLTLNGSFSQGSGTVFMEDSAVLDLNDKTFSLAITATGNATICNGTLNGNTLTVQDGAKLTMGDRVDTLGNLKLTLKENASVNLGGGNTLSGTVTVAGNASISNGTLNANVSVDTWKALTLGNDVRDGGCSITLANHAKLDLGGNTLFNTVTMGGSASIGNGSLNKDLTVEDSCSLTLSGDLSGSGAIILKHNASLETESGGARSNILYNTLKVAGDASIHGYFDGKIIVDAGKTLRLKSGTLATSGIELGQGTELVLGGNDILCAITLNGDARIESGTINASVNVGAGHTLTLGSLITGNGTITLNEASRLDTEEVSNTHHNAVKVAGDASIHASVSGKITVEAGKRLVMENGSTATGGIDLGQGSELDMGANTVGSTITLSGDARIGNGTINANVNVGSKLSTFGETHIKSGTISAGKTTVKALDTANPGLLQELSVSNGLIAGTDKQSSLADGLYIKSEADLLIESMTLTANNEIHVGDNTITLKDVTIKLSEDYFDRENPVEGVYYFKLQDLFHCDVEFNNVVFDATDLTLPQGHDSIIGIDFGNEVNIAKTDGMYLHMGGDWSQTMSMVDGKPVFTKLVPTPEPTTGTLSLLALAALAARRRKHN